MLQEDNASNGVVMGRLDWSRRDNHFASVLRHNVTYSMRWGMNPERMLSKFAMTVYSFQETQCYFVFFLQVFLQHSSPKAVVSDVSAIYCSNIKVP